MSPGQMCPSSSSSNTHGGIVFLTRRSLHPKCCMMVSPACLRWTEVSSHSFCDSVVQGILEHLCDLFHMVAGTIVKA